MKSEAKVYDRLGNHVGYTVENFVYDTKTIVKNIDLIDNLKLSKKGSIKVIGSKLPKITLAMANKQYARRFEKENSIIERKSVLEEMDTWKKKLSMLSLVVTGPPAVGKTTLVRMFAYKNYDRVYMVDLRAHDIRTKFNEYVLKNDNKAIGLADFCDKCLNTVYENNKHSVLILDNVNYDDNTLRELSTLQRYLGCNIIAVNSKAAFDFCKVNTTSSEYSYSIWVEPMTFMEFCKVIGRTRLVNKLSTCNIEDITSDNEKSINELLDIYKKIGGFPSVVRGYIRTQDIKYCEVILNNILNNIMASATSHIKDRDLAHDVSDSICRNLTNSLVLAGSPSGDAYSKIVKAVVSNIKLNNDIEEKDVETALCWLVNNKIVRMLSLLQGNSYQETIKNRRAIVTDNGLAYAMSNKYQFKEHRRESILNEHFVVNEFMRLYMRTRDIFRHRVQFVNDNTFGTYYLLPYRDGRLEAVKINENCVTGSDCRAASYLLELTPILTPAARRSFSSRTMPG